MLVATLCARLVKLTMPAVAVRFVAPCKPPLPALRAAVTKVLLSLLRKLPNWSSIRTTGCWTKATPAMVVEEGWTRIVKRFAAPAPSRTFDEVMLASEGALKAILIVSATLYERLVKLAKPPLTVALVMPCKAALPVFRAALITVELSLLRRFPNASTI